MKYLTFKNILIAVCLVIIAILLLRGCGNKGERAKEAKRISDSVASVYKTRIAIFESNEKILQDSLNEIAVKKEIIVQERDRLRVRTNKLTEQSVTLSKQLDIAKANKDTVEYYTICDSLGNLVIVLADEKKELEAYIDQADSLIIYETSIRDQVIELLQNKFVACDSAYSGEKKRFDAMYKNLKQRASLWAGGEISGNQITPFNQVGVVGSLVTKNGSKMFQVGGGLQVNGGYYVKVGASFKISFRK